MRSGRIIAGEREKVKSDSERERVRKRAKVRQRWSVVAIVAIIGLFVWLIWLGVGQVIKIMTAEPAVVDSGYEPTVEIIDEDGREKISGRVKEYVGQIEVDFQDLDYKVTKVVLPTGMAREVDVYLEGYDFYIKVDIDRGTAVSVEDADRMMRYLEENNIGGITYIDVRTLGRGYYK